MDVRSQRGGAGGWFDLPGSQAEPRALDSVTTCPPLLWNAVQFSTAYFGGALAWVSGSRIRPGCVPPGRLTGPSQDTNAQNLLSAAWCCAGGGDNQGHVTICRTSGSVLSWGGAGVEPAWCPLVFRRRGRDKPEPGHLQNGTGSILRFLVLAA